MSQSGKSRKAVPQARSHHGLSAVNSIQKSLGKTDKRTLAVLKEELGRLKKVDNKAELIARLEEDDQQRLRQSETGIAASSHSYNRAFQESLQQDPYASCVELGLATDGVVSDLRQRQQQQELAAQNMLSQSQILSAEMWIKSTHSNLEPFTDLQYDYRDFQARSEERTITFLQHQYARQDAVCHFNNIFKSCQCNPQEPQCIASKNSLFEDMCLGYRAQSTLPCLNRPLKRALANRIRNACTAQATDSGSRTFDFRLQNPARKSLCGVNLTDSGRSMPSIADILKVPSSKMDSGTYSTDTLRPQIPVQSDQKIPLHGTRPSSDQT